MLDTGTRLVGGLIALVMVAVIIGFVFTQFTELDKAVQGRCIQTGDRTATTGAPPLDTTWAVGQSWQAGGPWASNTTPTGTCTTSTSVTANGATFIYVASAISDTPIAGIISTLINIAPVILLVAVLFVLVMGVFGFKDKIFGRNQGVPI